MRLSDHRGSSTTSLRQLQPALRESRRTDNADMEQVTTGQRVPSDMIGRPSPSAISSLVTPTQIEQSSGVGDEFEQPQALPLPGGVSFNIPRNPPAISRHSWTRESIANYPNPDLSFLEGLGIGQRELTDTVPAWSESRNSPRKSCKSAIMADGTKNGATTMVIGAPLRHDRSQHSHSVQVVEDLADSRGSVVAVDLDTLQGPSFMNEGLSTTVEGGIISDRQSYYFPADPDVPDWKPPSMRSFDLFALILIAFAMAGAQEYLCQLCQKKQSELPSIALLSFNSTADITKSVSMWKYLPTLIAVSYSILVSTLDRNVRRLEPFYQLSQHQGAPAVHGLGLDHITVLPCVVPFNAARLQQWAVLASSVPSLLAGLVGPTLQVSTLQFVENKECEYNSTTGNCQDLTMKRSWMLIDPTSSRLFTASYILVGIALGFAFVRLRRRKSGLLNDPRGIDRIASMATKSYVLKDFTDTQLMTQAQICAKIKHSLYLV